MKPMPKVHLHVAAGQLGSIMEVLTDFGYQAQVEVFILQEVLEEGRTEDIINLNLKEEVMAVMDGKVDLDLANALAGEMLDLKKHFNDLDLKMGAMETKGRAAELPA